MELKLGSRPELPGLDGVPQFKDTAYAAHIMGDVPKAFPADLPEEAAVLCGIIDNEGKETIWVCLSLAHMESHYRNYTKGYEQNKVLAIRWYITMDFASLMALRAHIDDMNDNGTTT